MNRIDPLSRSARALAVLLALGASSALLASAASAGGTANAARAGCGKQVVADWYDNGRIDKLYKLACYREAIRIIPVDVRDYSNAIEEITRALQYAKRGQRAPVKPARPPTGTGPTTATTGGETRTGTSGTGTTRTGTTKTKTKPPKTGRTTTDPGALTVGGPGGSSFTDAGGNVDTSGPSSVPVPLIVLGGLALLLLAAGSAGYLSRRFNARRGPGDGPPPSSA